MISCPEIGKDIEAIQHRLLREMTFDFLGRPIAAGNRAPDECLSQEEIASRLGVSRTPVREGHDLLVSSGPAEYVPDRGVQAVR